MKISKFDGTSDTEAARAKPRAEVNRTETAPAAAQPEGAASSREADSVSVSDRAATVSNLVARAKELPDVRQERVEPLRGAVNSGSYKPSAEDIADAIINHEGQ